MRSENLVHFLHEPPSSPWLTGLASDGTKNINTFSCWLSCAIVTTCHTHAEHRAVKLFSCSSRHTRQQHNNKSFVFFYIVTFPHFCFSMWKKLRQHSLSSSYHTEKYFDISLHSKGAAITHISAPPLCLLHCSECFFYCPKAVSGIGYVSVSGCHRSVQTAQSA